jgi:hypothetical protein
MFDDLKVFNSQKYTGMIVGGEHHWMYPNGLWDEKKTAPERWEFTFTSLKRRCVPAPDGSGAPNGTSYHWYILADQKVTKISKDEYETMMQGLKFKIGHKRPYWRGFSYTYKDQKSYRQRLIEILRDTLLKLEQEEAQEQGAGIKLQILT